MALHVQRIPASLLEEFARGTYVDSPVYFSAPGWVRRMNWTKLERLYAMMGREANLRVLDFACGNGVMLPTWETNFEMTVAIDLHVTAADRVRSFYRLQNVHLARTDGTILPFSSGSFDRVFAASTLEHFPDLKKPLIEIQRVLRKGGELLFLCPNENHFYDWGRRIAGYEKPPDHYHTAAEVISTVRGFLTVEEVSSFPSLVPSWLSVYQMGRAVKK